MNRLFFVFLIFAFLSCNSEKNTKVKSIQGEETVYNETEFAFTEEMHNFGLLQSGEIVVFAFEFTNTGNTDLIIQTVETDCGCIRAEFNKKPVPPGEKGTVEIEFNSAGLFGKQFKSIEIHANTKKPKQLAIFAEVQNEEIEIKY